MGIEILFLILAIAVVAFGIAVVVVNRRKAAGPSAPSTRTAAPTTPPPRETGGGAATAVEERPDTAVEVVEEEPEVVEPVKPASLRDRLAKARLAFSGAVVGVLGRSGITEESFEDLEEALLRADVGVGVTTDLLDGLRAKVASKEITEPQALVDELEAEMVSAPRRIGSYAGVRPGCRRPERLDVRRGQRRREDHDDRQARQPADA